MRRVFIYATERRRSKSFLIITDFLRGVVDVLSPLVYVP